jgi:hypothetical protein
LFLCGADLCGDEDDPSDDEDDDSDVAYGPRPQNFYAGGLRASQVQKEIRNAQRVALKALKKPSCAGLFGLTPGSPDAATELQSLLADLSQVLIGNIVSSQPNIVTSATTSASSPYSVPAGDGTMLLYSSVTIKINSFAGTFVTGTLQDQATTLLHELGHAFDFLFGPNSTKIVDDGNSTQTSKDNTALVKQQCFN